MTTRGVGGASPSNITRYLRGVDFPARKQDLIRRARDDNAEDEVIRQLEQMPDQEFRSMSDVMSAVGQADRTEDDESR